MMSDVSFFFFNDTATTEIYTLSLHDALPISDILRSRIEQLSSRFEESVREYSYTGGYTTVYPIKVNQDRKSTRLNSSHANISYAVFCLKKKKKNKNKFHYIFLQRKLAYVI